MASTLNYPFKSSGFSVQRNEILTVQTPAFTNLLQGDGATTTFSVFSEEGKNCLLYTSDAADE